MKKITEGTFLPISLIITLITFISLASWWASATEGKVLNHEKRIEEVSTCGKEIQKELKKISVDIAEIKTELKINGAHK